MMGQIRASLHRASRSLRATPRHWVLRLAGLVLVWWLLFPPRAWAGCGATDPGACMDNALYQGELMLMALLWDINQTLLLVARNVEALREWLIAEVLGTAFDAIIAGIQFPFWIAAAIAWLVFVVGYFLQALVDGLQWVSLKRLIQYGGLALFLFQVGSQAVSATEQIRVSAGRGFAQIAGTSINQVTEDLDFYAADDSSMDAPHTIYGGDVCPGLSTQRSTPGLYLNDLAANYLWADAKDIHCPDQAEGRADVPVEFGNRYAPPPMQIDDEEPEVRQRKMKLAWDGVSRLGWGLPLATAGLIEQIMHLLFALALASTWIGLLIGLLFALFVATEGMFKAHLQGIITTWKTAWLGSFWMALVLGVLYLAALSGSGVIVGGLGVLACGVAGWQTKTAAQSFLTAAQGVSGVMSHAPSAIGGALKGMLGPAGMLAGAALGAGGALLGAKDAVSTYREGRELGLERWQAADHAQTAWGQRTANPLTRWRNQQRLTRQMVREKLGDERLLGQVEELRARGLGGDDLGDRLAHAAADDSWAETRAYAQPTGDPPGGTGSGPATPVIRTRPARAADPAPGAVDPYTGEAVSACPGCGQLLTAQALRAHVCPQRAASASIHAADTQRLTPKVAGAPLPPLRAAPQRRARGGRLQRRRTKLALGPAGTQMVVDTDGAPVAPDLRLALDGDRDQPGVTPVSPPLDGRAESPGSGVTSTAASTQPIPADARSSQWHLAPGDQRTVPGHATGSGTASSTASGLGTATTTDHLRLVALPDQPARPTGRIASESPGLQLTPPARSAGTAAGSVPADALAPRSRSMSGQRTIVHPSGTGRPSITINSLPVGGLAVPVRPAAPPTPGLVPASAPAAPHPSGDGPPPVEPAPVAVLPVPGADPGVAVAAPSVPLTPEPAPAQTPVPVAPVVSAAAAPSRSPSVSPHTVAHPPAGDPRVIPGVPVGSPSSAMPSGGAGLTGSPIPPVDRAMRPWQRAHQRRLTTLGPRPTPRGSQTKGQGR
ncbi:MAG TPA: hypothetical protein VFZ66_27800 [Herpetosiphonaceae bacterium]